MMNSPPTHTGAAMWATNERFLQAGTTFRVSSASERHWLQPMLVLTVHWWDRTSMFGWAISHRSTTLKSLWWMDQRYTRMQDFPLGTMKLQIW